MKRTITIMILLVMVLTLATPVFASENAFVPSISYKPAPKIVTTTDEAGNEALGVFVNEAGEVVDYARHGCLIITPLADALDEEKPVPKVIRDLLLYVYDALRTEEMEIPYEKLELDLVNENMVVRDLYDIRWACKEHEELLNKEGVTFRIIFDLDMEPDVLVHVLSYDEYTEEWEPIVKSENNGDGTVTCVFEHFCVASFSVEVAPQRTASFPWLWVLLLMAALFLLIVLIIKRRSEEEQTVA